MRLRFELALFLIVIAALPNGPAGIFAQATNPNPQGAEAVMPTDPDALMLLAARVNGLSGADMKPWHLKASYQTFDSDGKPKDQGTFEEWWAGPEKYKLSYSSAGFNQVRYETGSALLMTGDGKAPSLAEAMVENFLVRPMPEASEIKTKRYVAHGAKDGPVALTCLREDSKSDIIPVYCFEKDSPALRLEVLRDGNMAFFNGIVPMDGQYLPKQIDVKFANLAVLNVQVTALEPLAKVDDAAFVPPAGAVRASLPPLFEPLGGMHLISVGKDIQTPAIALAAHVQETVILAVTISTSGSVRDARVISGPAMLRQAAVDSVKSYRFTPYKVKGQATEVEILVHCEFRRY